MKQNDQASITLKACWNPPLFSLSANAGSRSVGKLVAALHSEGVVLLSEIWVEYEVAATSKPTSWMLRWLCSKPQVETFRGRGIGSQMLEQFFGWCRDKEISEVYGSIVQVDMDESPWLLEWYRRHGFEVRPPDDRCLRNAVCMVVWQSGS